MLKVQGFTVPQTLEEVISPDNTALLIYDMQAGITRQIANGDEIVRRVRLILESARRIGMRTFFTRHMSLPKNLMGAFQFRTALAWQRVDSPDKIQPMFLRDSPTFQIIPELQPLPSEAIFDNLAMSALVATSLDMVLRDFWCRRSMVAGADR